MLTTQYRMHPNIAAWPNKYFYSGCIHQGVTHPEIKLAPYTLIDSNTIQTGNGEKVLTVKLSEISI